jgi:uncharacterized protein
VNEERVAWVVGPVVAGVLALLLAVGLVLTWRPAPDAAHQSSGAGMDARPVVVPTEFVLKPLRASAPAALRRLVDGGVAQTSYTVFYDPSYVPLKYPSGDVPIATGVCADVIVRAFRKAGLDLQVALHEDMSRHFGAYPQRWGESGPDKNIDHRRVANLAVFFTRKGKAVRITHRAADYRPGDVVVWRTAPGREHTGLVTNYWSPRTKRYAIVHNIGDGAQVRDVLFDWPIIGHFRYY